MPLALLLPTMNAPDTVAGPVMLADDVVRLVDVRLLPNVAGAGEVSDPVIAHAPLIATALVNVAAPDTVTVFANVVAPATDSVFASAVDPVADRLEPTLSTLDTLKELSAFTAPAMRSVLSHVNALVTFPTARRVNVVAPFTIKELFNVVAPATDKVPPREVFCTTDNELLMVVDPPTAKELL